VVVGASGCVISGVTISTRSCGCASPGGLEKGFRAPANRPETAVFGKTLRFAVVEQAGHHETLSSPSSTSDSARRVDSAGMEKPLKVIPLGVSIDDTSCAVQLHFLFLGHHRRKSQADSEITELYGHRARIPAALQNGNRELSPTRK